jgi:spore germination protein GerM
MTKNLLLTLLLGIALFGINQPAAAQTGGTMQISIYFPTEEDEAMDKLVMVRRSIKKTTRVAEAALRELFKGVTETEHKQGLTSAYAVTDIVTGRGECQGNKMKPLGAYLIGVTIKRGTATVNFRPEAECYLQSAISQMDRVMNPIEKTLMQFKSIKEVQFALNGKVITEWDA